MLLHGFLCDLRCWRQQFNDLAGQFKLVAWDAPGAGLSSDPPDTFTVTDWAATLAGFLDAVGVTRGHMLGLSWGGLAGTGVLSNISRASGSTYSGRHLCRLEGIAS